jgi:hypothetical protein
VRGQLNYQHTPATDDPSWADVAETWKDLITSVDIFVSAPIYTYDQSGAVAYIKEYAASDIPLHRGDKVDAATGTPSGTEAGYNASTFYFKNVEDVDNDGASERYLKIAPSSYRIALPDFDEEELKEKHVSTASFYLLKSIAIDELVTDKRTAVEVNDDYLGSLQTRETLTDDYDSHDTLIPSTAYVYNNRLNLAGLVKHRRAAFDMLLFLQYRTPAKYISGTSYTTQFIVRLLVDGKSYYVDGGSCNYLVYDDLKRWFYYPDTAAKEVIVIQKMETSVADRFSFKLTPHDFLNGAYAYLPAFTSEESTPELSVPPIATPILNKIYTSEVDNPFLFPVTNINTVGSGEVKALASATKALSEGQFGQFPMYAFTDEGVWALEVSTTTGGFASRQPVGRDVILSSDSVCQIDDSVLFATSRGIMQLSGSQSVCISDVLTSAEGFSLAKLPKLLTAFQNLPAYIEPFTTYLADAVMLYDYVHQRLYVSNEAYSYTYVFSLKSKMWAMTSCVFNAALNAYPDCLAVRVAGGKNLMVSPSDTKSGGNTAFIITRPFSMQSPDGYKTVFTLLQRGVFARGKFSVVLYGTRDWVHWHIVSSTVTTDLRRFAGSSWRAFRLAVCAPLGAEESLSRFSVEFEKRLNDKIR